MIKFALHKTKLRKKLQQQKKNCEEETSNEQHEKKNQQAFTQNACIQHLGTDTDKLMFAIK